MKKIAIIGAGGFGREVKMLIDQINDVNPKYEFIGYYDDGIEKSTKINNHSVIGNIYDLNKVDELTDVAIAVGNPQIKQKIISKLNNKNISFPTLIHPSVIIGSEEVVLGVGNIICAGTIITCNVTIENFVILNLNCTVGHDTVIKSYASFMPSVNISGEVVVNESAYVGTGAKIINQLEIGKNTIVGAGAVVSKTLPANCTAVGIPAKPINFHE